MPSHYFPAIGAYIVFTIDVEATISTHNDPILRRAVRAMKLKTYAGFVSAPDLCAPWWRCVSVHLLGQGIAKADEEKFITPSMCSPILPETSHPNDREPIAPSTPLPWKNCYHYTHTAPVKVRTNWKKTRKTPRHSLAAGQIEDYEMRQAGDVVEYARRRNPELWARLDEEELACENTKSLEWGSSSLDSTSINEPDERFGDSDDGDHSDEDLEEWVLEDGSCDSTLEGGGEGEERTVGGLFKCDDSDESIPVVRASYKLSQVKASELSDPAEFWDDIETLRRLVQESKERAIVQNKEAEGDSQRKGGRMPRRRHSILSLGKMRIFSRLSRLLRLSYLRTTWSRALT